MLLNVYILSLLSSSWSCPWNLHLTTALLYTDITTHKFHSKFFCLLHHVTHLVTLLCSIFILQEGGYHMLSYRGFEWTLISGHSRILWLLSSPVKNQIKMQYFSYLVSCHLGVNGCYYTNLLFHIFLLPR